MLIMLALAETDWNANPAARHANASSVGLWLSYLSWQVGAGRFNFYGSE
jgi:hypothetical protein